MACEPAFAPGISLSRDCADPTSPAYHPIIEAVRVEATLYPEEGAKKVRSKCNSRAGFHAVEPITLIQLDAVRNMPSFPISLDHLPSVKTTR